MKEIVKANFPCYDGFRRHRHPQHGMGKGTDSQNCNTVILYDLSILAIKFNFQMNFNNIHVKSMYLKTVFYSGSV